MMKNVLYKIKPQISRSNIKDFEDEHGFKPTKDADLTEFGYAWGAIEDAPTITNTQALDQAAPVLIGAFVSQGWTVRDKTEAEILASTPWQDLASAQVALSQWIDNLTFQIEGKYPRIIRAAWDEEEAMALAYKLGTETEAQLAELTALAETKNRTVDEHADRVLWLAGTFRAIKGHVHALWLATDAALEAATSPLEYEHIFEAAKHQAAPLAAAYGLTT